MRFNANRKPRNDGFTLVELLVAIGILAMVAVLGWRGLDGIIRARVALSDNLEQTRGLQLAFAQLQNDCANMTPVANLFDRAAVQTGGRNLLIVRNVINDHQPVRVQVVRYRIRNGMLTRWESPAVRDVHELDRWLQFARGEATVSQEVALRSGVDSMSLRTWNNGWQGGDNAIPQDGGANTNGLEVTLLLQGHDQSLKKIFLLGAA